MRKSQLRRLFCDRLLCTSSILFRRPDVASQDPIQRIFIEKLREFMTKQEQTGAGRFVDPQPQFLNEYNEALQRIQRIHAITEEVTTFPKMSFAEPMVNIIRVEEEKPLEDMDKQIEKEEKTIASSYFPLQVVKMETKGYALEALTMDGSYQEPDVKSVVNDPMLLSTVDDEIMGADDFIIKFQHLDTRPKIPDQKLIETPQSKDFELNF
ncbi:unnamed protein product [Soboliphyme baturini]|uniref:ATP synthase-coupling factor 6, mitochondrial n=1 Tax=Soboliphyme baturini TaxID=241478 RepID=A0A183ID75_9BILA|nr:unnamed protein product [Soboliphyme baturini]